MTVQESLYHQEVLILAYMYLHPDELQRLNKNDFSNVSTMQLFELMCANYKYNQNKCIQSYQIISAMTKNKRFERLLDQTDLIIRVLTGKEEYIVTKTIFDEYVKGLKQRSENKDVRR